MSQLVPDSTGEMHEFPDDATEAEIRQAMGETAPAPAAPPAHPVAPDNPLRALVPRAVKGYEAGSFDRPGGATAALLTGAGDVADMPRRSYLALKEMLVGGFKPEAMMAAGEQATRPPEGFGEQLASELPFAATPIGAGRSLAAAAARRIPAAAPKFVAPLVERLTATLLGRGAENLPTTALHQAQDVAAGKEPSATGALAELGTGIGLPAAAGAVGRLAKQRARQVIQTAVKTSALKSAAHKTLTDEQADRVLTDYGSLRGLSGIAEKMEKAHDVLSSQFDRLINLTAQGKRVNLRGALAQAEHELDALEKAGELNLDDVVAMRTALGRWKDASASLTNEGGWTDFATAQNFKKNTLDQLARYSKIPREMQLPGVPGTAAAARLSRRQIAAQMGRLVPEMRPLNEEFQRLAELEPHVVEALERSARNRGWSMLDILSLTGGLGAAAGVTAMDKPELGGVALLPFLLARGQKSPGAATAAHRGGRLLERLSSMRGATLPARVAVAREE